MFTVSITIILLLPFNLEDTRIIVQSEEEEEEEEEGGGSVLERCCKSEMNHGGVQEASH
ncbi:hypothetical protein INR49_022682 [Caranx melampygus]|nr:hypothetical protein INR49_022682 [Caranx melampygus]